MPYDNYLEQDLYLKTMDLGADVKWAAGEWCKDNMHTAIPAIIEEFNSVEQRAVVQITVKARIRIDSGERDEREDRLRPLLVDVPVQFPQAGGYSLTFPVKKGDECVVFFCERDISNWKNFGGIQPIGRDAPFNVNNAVAVLGFSSIPKKISNFATDATELRNSTTNQVISLKESGDILIKSPTQVTIDTPKTHITGELTVDGATELKSTLKVTGVADFMANVNVAGSLGVVGGGNFGGDVAINNISFGLHIHKDAEDRPTSGPQV